MINKIQDNDLDFQVNFNDNNSIDSMDDFQTSVKYITFNPSTNRLGISNPKVNLAKKNTRMSSNNDEDNESENNNLNENNENKSSNLLHVQTPIKEYFKDFKFQKKYKNDKKDNYSNNNNIYMNEINQVLTSPGKSRSKNNNNNNNIKKLFFSENNGIIKSDDLLNLNNQITEENGGSYTDRSKPQNLKDKENENDIDSLNKKKKKKFLVLQEKKKKSKNKKSLYSKNKDILEKKENEEEEKIIRKDKNGVPICKKNRKKVKISFERPFVNVTYIECYKKYNVIIGMPKDDNFMDDNCQCCTII